MTLDKNRDLRSSADQGSRSGGPRPAVSADQRVRAGGSRLAVSGDSKRSASSDVSDDGFHLVARKKKQKPIIGTSRQETSLRVSNGCHTSVFISRLESNTTEDDIVKFVEDSLKLTVSCTKLETKHSGYASFRVNAICDNPSVLYDSNTWPQGVLVRKFYLKNHSNYHYGYQIFNI